VDPFDCSAAQNPRVTGFRGVVAEVSVLLMTKNNSSAKSLLVFVFTWHVVWFVVSLLCIVLFFSGHLIPGFLAILIFGYCLVRDCRATGRMGSVRRTYDPSKAPPELRVGARTRDR
jgi:hypothetical protein